MTSWKQHIDRRAFMRTLAQASGTALCASTLGPAALRAQTSGITPNVLLVYCSGGWDPTMVFDDKVGVLSCAQESGARTAKSAAAASLNYVNHPGRPAVKTFFDTYGAKAAIVNGISAGSMSSRQAAFLTLGTVPERRYRPVDWLSFYAYSLAPVLELPHVVIDAPYMPGEFESIATRLSGPMIEGWDPANTPAPEPELGSTGEAGLAKFRQTAFAPIVAAGNGSSLDTEKLRALYYGQARDQILGVRLPQILQDLGPRPSGQSDFARYGRLAVELFAKGYTQCVTLQAGRDQAWDTYDNHYARQNALYQSLFDDLNGIMTHASDKGVLGKTLIILMSEMGKSPTLNAASGKGPWAFTSTLLWGPGIAGGTVAGQTDAILRGLPLDPVFGTVGGNGAVTLEMGHVIAAVYLKTGVPVTLMLPNHKPLSTIIQTAS